jgi:pSer/pThr/pTyr-binding forkhead associated (FHA) protein
MICAACNTKTAEVGLLCDDCRDDLKSSLRLAPEQLISRPTGASGPRSALVDAWGRAHWLEARTLIGRQLDGAGLSILEVSISRHHAHVSYDPGAKVWSLRDLGSANGTMVNEVPINDAVILRNADRVSVGQVGFYFLSDGERLPLLSFDPNMAVTVRSSDSMRLEDIVAREAAAKVRLANKVKPRAESDVDDGENEFSRAENTDVGIPLVEIDLVEPTGGGGGVVTVSGRQMQLTTTQFELVALLVNRMANESHQSDLVRGFVRSSELIADLSWDTKDPSDNHVKQLVRRVRRALIKAEIGDLIESRHRFGYRLRAIPKLK